MNKILQNSNNNSDFNYRKSASKRRQNKPAKIQVSQNQRAPKKEKQAFNIELIEKNVKETKETSKK